MESNKEQALQAALKQIERQFGKGTVMRMGDRENVDFTPNDFNPERLSEFKEAGISVVSVFLSGRPLWTNPEINASDAFIAAWLPR